MTTGSISETSATGATLSASFSGESGAITDAGFYYGTTSGSLGNKVSSGYTTSPFSKAINGLEQGTTYYYKAYVVEGDQEVLADNEESFTTLTGWLELPKVTGSEDFVGKLYGSGSTAGTNRNYSYSYNYTYYASMWVAYPLCGTHKSGSGGEGNWTYNPSIPNNKQVSIVSKSYPTMYGASAYARGHQCPNASRKSNEQMNDQTYYATNQTPQLQNKFNASIWGSLEGAVRGLVSSATDTVYVVTGPAYRKVGGSETINYLYGASGQNANPSELPIPNYYWKALLKVKRGSHGEVTSAKAIGFWFDHRNYESTEHYYDSQNVVSVDQIEAWTGLNLFHNLPGDDSSGMEKTAESNTSWTEFQNF